MKDITIKINESLNYHTINKHHNSVDFSECISYYFLDTLSQFTRGNINKKRSLIDALADDPYGTKDCEKFINQLAKDIIYAGDRYVKDDDIYDNWDDFVDEIQGVAQEFRDTINKYKK